MWYVVLSLIALATPQAAAAAPELHWPLACTPGRGCWAVRFPDLDPGPGVRDWMCGTHTYDGHDGTDIAIPDLAAMRRGVPVLAAASGVVRAVRDGMDDVRVDAIDPSRIAGRECGNGVLIEHGDGFETQYCHLRQGSIRVRPGDRVEAGTPLGLVGLSGNTNFPHLEVIVRQQGQTIDPLRGLGAAPDCGPGTAPLWSPEARAAISYEPVYLTKIGIASDRPDWLVVQEGGLAATELPPSIPALVLWVEGYGLQADDRIRFEIVGPAGASVFSAEARAETAKARFFRFAGRRPPPEGFAPGRYLGRIELYRNGARAASREIAFLLR
jgi:hypothetical protein